MSLLSECCLLGADVGGNNIEEVFDRSHRLRCSLHALSSPKFAEAHLGKRLRWDVGFLVMKSNGAICGDFVPGDFEVARSSVGASLSLIRNPLQQANAGAKSGWADALLAITEGIGHDGGPESHSGQDEYSNADSDFIADEDGAKRDFADALAAMGGLGAEAAFSDCESEAAVVDEADGNADEPELAEILALVGPE